MSKKGSILFLALVAIVGASILGVRAVKADDSNFYPPMVEKLVEKFGLNEDEVETFFEEQRQERWQQRQQWQEEKLGQAVSDGVITEEQKQALLDKWEEMRAEREQHRQEMQAWFEEQGIDHEALRQYGGCGHRGFGRDWGMGGF